MLPLVGVALLALMPAASQPPPEDLAAARTEMEAGRPRGAVRVLEAALEAGAAPGGDRSLLLAEAWLAAGERRRAEAALRHGLEATPRDTRLHRSLARSLADRGRVGDALATSRGAILLDASPPDPWLELAELVERSGATVEGLLLRVRFLTLEPDGERAALSARRVVDGIAATGRLELGIGTAREEATRQAFAAVAVRLGALVGGGESAARPAAAAAALEALCQVLAAHPRADDLFEGGALHGFFAGAALHGHAAALGRDVLVALRDPEIDVWRAAHAEDVRRWRAWHGRAGSSLPH